MARTKEIIPEAEINTPEVNTPEEEKADKVENTPKVKVNKATTSKVSVRFLTDGKSIVAGTAYTYKKGQEAKVPEDVAAILVNGDLAIKL